jgi:hypothetical protein
LDLILHGRQLKPGSNAPWASPLGADSTDQLIEQSSPAGNADDLFFV